MKKTSAEAFGVLGAIILLGLLFGLWGFWLAPHYFGGISFWSSWGIMTGVYAIIPQKIWTLPTITFFLLSAAIWLNLV